MSDHPKWHVAVVIPARDEEALIGRCICSVQAARAILPPFITSDVVIVSDRSMDRTLQLAMRGLAGDGVVLDEDAGCVGAARALAADRALARAPSAGAHCWLANTDADCQVPEDWLHKQIALAEQGFDAVAGIIDVDSFEEHSPQVRDLFRTTYLLHEDGSHPHIHGANLGVRADAYLRSGGWARLANAEDHDLWSRLRRSGNRCLSTSDLQVLTSGRRVGRAPKGFAEALAAHNEQQASGTSS